MSSLYHLTPDGPKICQASVRACPLGGEHFISQAAAETAFASQHDAFTGVSKRPGGLQGSIVTSVAPQAGGRYYGCYVESKSVEQHLAAFREEVGEARAALMEQNKLDRDRAKVYHLTVVGPPEMKKLRGKMSAFPELVSVKYLGVGSANDGKSEAWFVVCESPEIAQWREENNLAPKDLHVTLGFDPKDVHTEPKGPSSLVLK